MSTQWGDLGLDWGVTWPNERLDNHVKIISESTDYLRGQTYLNTGKDFLIMCTYEWVAVCRVNVCVCVRVCIAGLLDSLWAVELS